MQKLCNSRSIKQIKRVNIIKDYKETKYNIKTQMTEETHYVLTSLV